MKSALNLTAMIAILSASQSTSHAGTDQQVTPPDFGKNVVIFDSSTPATVIQNKVDAIYKQQESDQFGSNRYAILLKPGRYHNNIKVGFYTQLLGLGNVPDAVAIEGDVQVNAAWHNSDATQNFWRGVENLSLTPASGTMKWAVSQASPLRRLHVRGNMVLDDNGWSSGGFIADTQVDNQVNSGIQQQWLSRNSRLDSWASANWNMVFVGVDNAPSGANWPNPPYTVIKGTPVVREKPLLTVDQHDNYSVFVPKLSKNSHGTSWSNSNAEGEHIPINQFYIAKAETDTATSLNAALTQGKHLLLTPGIYKLNDTLHITRPNTVVLGLGLATLQPLTGLPAMIVDDVDGVKLAGLLFDAGATNSTVLARIGQADAKASHADNPTSLHDLFFRVGGAGVGNATLSLEINSNDVIGDDLWLWRADHGTGIGWSTNTTTNGLIVNGDNVSIYGLAVEHFHQYQTIWNGNNGAVYFYQSEAPYDVPDQASWMNGKVNGYASYKVADKVTKHQAWGVGIYCFFDTNPEVKLQSAIEVPDNSTGLNGAMFRDMTTVSLGGTGEITHVINNWGSSATPTAQVIHLAK